MWNFLVIIDNFAATKDPWVLDNHLINLQKRQSDEFKYS